jgi:hypothetical protein
MGTRHESRISHYTDATERHCWGNGVKDRLNKGFLCFYNQLGKHRRKSTPAVLTHPRDVPFLQGGVSKRGVTKYATPIG